MIFISQFIIFIALAIFFYLLADEMFQESDISWFSQKRRKAGFENQLVESLMIISSSLKAGRNLEQAFELVALSMPSPTCDEFRMVLQERKLGVTLDKALDNLRDRVQSEDLELVINAINFWRGTGGKLEDMFKQIVHTVSERKKIMGKVKAGTAHARLSGMVVSCIPILVLFTMIFSGNPSFTSFWKNPIGATAILIALSLIVLGFVITHKLTQGILPERGMDIYIQNDPALKRRKFWLYHLFSNFLTPIVQHLKDPFSERERNRVEKKLILAGRPGELSSDQFLALKFLSGVLGFLVMAFVGFKIFQLQWMLSL
ncbi:type II secretion system F family protein, partial [Candidatus Riflebacteria bacterium]